MEYKQSVWVLVLEARTLVGPLDTMNARDVRGERDDLSKEKDLYRLPTRIVELLGFLQALVCLLRNHSCICLLVDVFRVCRRSETGT